MDGFTAALAVTVVLRGLGAGFILGVELMTLPTRIRLDPAVFATFMREAYRQVGVRLYAALTILGFLATLTLAAWASAGAVSTSASLLIWLSLAATFLGFVGTAGALPAMQALWRTPNEDLTRVASHLDRFSFWSMVSTVGHLVAFGLLVPALALAAR
jgi:hypothetical protein